MSLKPLEKQPTESKVYTFDFGPDMATGETINTPVTALTSTPSGLTVGSAVISGQKVFVRYEGGTTGTLYKQTCRVTTSDANVLEIDGYLAVGVE